MCRTPVLKTNLKFNAFYEFFELHSIRQGCGLGLETYLRSRLGLVSDKFANVSVSVSRLKVSVLVSAVKVSQIRPRFWHVIVVRISRVNGLVLLFCCNIKATAIIGCIIRLHRLNYKHFANSLWVSKVSRPSRDMPKVSSRAGKVSVCEGLGPIPAIRLHFLRTNVQYSNINNSDDVWMSTVALYTQEGWGGCGT